MGDKIYITGHRNPDLDSVCSAYGYAVLKNILDPQNEYIPVRCGHLGPSLKEILATLEIDVPHYMHDVNPRVSDVVLTGDHTTYADESLKSVAMKYDDANPSVVPVFDGDKFYGLLSIDDITAWVMGKLSRSEVIEEAPIIRDIMREQAPALQLTDMFDESKARLKSCMKRGLAVLDGDEYVGFVTRRCFLKTPKYKVIMVDHNEPGQSIRGIENAELVEIIDHHRLDALKTTLPIFIDAEPLGSTCTIVFQQFLRNRLSPDPVTARVLLTGIISDTLILRSPTTTAVDIDSAERLAKICDVKVEEFGRSMFSHVVGLNDLDPVTAIKGDFKKYKERGVKVGIGQCEVTTLMNVDEYMDKYRDALELVRSQSGLDWAVLMITDVLEEHSILLSTEFKATRHLSYSLMTNNTFDMPGVMSRKKQLLPEILHAMEV